MPKLRIPLVGNPNQRGLRGSDVFINGGNLLTEGSDTLVTEGNEDTLITESIYKDQVYVNCVPVIYSNPVTQKSTVYLQKRYGTTAAAISGSSEVTANFYSNAQALVYEATGQTIYRNGASIGSITANRFVYYITSTQISGKECVAFVSYDTNGNNSEGWYHFQDADGATFTADTDSSNAILTNVSSTAGLYVGQAISGTGIGTGARIQSIDSATQITLTVQSTATNTTVTMTPTALAKVISTNFPTNAQGGFAFLDGYSFIQDVNGKVWNSNINTITTWGASSYISANKSPDIGKGVYVWKNYVVAFGKDSTEFFQNAGNPSGSVLRRIDGMARRIGIKSVTDTITGTPVHSFAYAKNVEDDLYFAGQSKNAMGVYRISESGLEKVSTQHIDNIIYLKTPQISSVFCGGQIGVAVSCDLEVTGYPGDAMVYWPSSKVWTYWTSPTDGGSDRGMWGRCSIDVSTFTNYLCGINGKRFTTDVTAFSDDGVAFDMFVQTPKLDLGTQNRKKIKSIGLVCDEQAAGTVTVEFSDDDFESLVTLGTLDITGPQPRLYRGGSFRGGRAWRLTHNDTEDFRAEAIEIEYEEGSH